MMPWPGQDDATPSAVALAQGLIDYHSSGQGHRCDDGPGICAAVKCAQAILDLTAENERLRVGLMNIAGSECVVAECRAYASALLNESGDQ